MWLCSVTVWLFPREGVAKSPCKCGSGGGIYKEGTLTEDTMLEIMSEVKKGELDKVTFSSDTLRKYFPRSYTPQKMQDTIIKLLEQWQRKRQQQHQR